MDPRYFQKDIYSKDYPCVSSDILGEDCKKVSNHSVEINFRFVTFQNSSWEIGVVPQEDFSSRQISYDYPHLCLATAASSHATLSLDRISSPFHHPVVTVTLDMDRRTLLFTAEENIAEPRIPNNMAAKIEKSRLGWKVTFREIPLPPDISVAYLGITLWRNGAASLEHPCFGQFRESSDQKKDVE